MERTTGGGVDDRPADPDPLARIEDQTLDAKYRDQLCIAVLPFLHARPVATLTAKCSFEMSDDEINAVIAREEAYRRGELAQVVRLPVRR